ncbi:arginase family protein [Streptomyces sp. NBC_00582]|uniref:arginase family protein n=1 Tax=Streptomyces sp. NBC_00582 TaxID=2975783 RepID=UPI002E80A650|nr:arginase family protein [Streptomyces sp. NBC_00582]WUB60643.1 arginase family protein [Streptomyces sp. NBC_00582]
MRNFVVADAPLQPRPAPAPAPVPGTVPDCHKLAGALREQGVLRRLGTAEGGVVPPRYDRGGWREGDGVFNAAALTTCTRRLADRIERHVRAGGFPVVLGGDCSIQLGASLAPRRLGRYGLAAVDASPDFRHPGNSDRVGAAGGDHAVRVPGDRIAAHRGRHRARDDVRAELGERLVGLVHVRDRDRRRHRAQHLQAPAPARSSAGSSRRRPLHTTASETQGPGAREPLVEGDRGPQIVDTEPRGRSRNVRTGSLVGAGAGGGSLHPIPAGPAHRDRGVTAP